LSSSARRRERERERERERRERERILSTQCGVFDCFISQLEAQDIPYSNCRLFPARLFARSYTYPHKRARAYTQRVTHTLTRVPVHTYTPHTDRHRHRQTDRHTDTHTHTHTHTQDRCGVVLDHLRTELQRARKGRSKLLPAESFGRDVTSETGGRAERGDAMDHGDAVKHRDVINKSMHVIGRLLVTMAELDNQALSLSLSLSIYLSLSLSISLYLSQYTSN
jgi:hypothetical protein